MWRIRVFRPILLLLLLLKGAEAARAQEPVAADSSGINLSGLQFVSHYAIKDERTSLNLTPDNPLNLSGDFSLDFDVRFGSAVYTFGYVFRLILDGQTNFDMISDMSSGAHVDFVLGDRSVAEFLPSEESPGFGYDRWMPVSIRTDHLRDSIVLTFAGVEKRIAGSLESSRAELWFGACYHDDFYTTDVPLIAVRDIRILNGHGKPLRYWKLGRHAGETVYDETDRHPARAVNPIWLIDDYARWEKRLSETVPQGYLQVAADPDSGKIYFAAGRYVGLYDNSSPKEALEPLAVKNRLPFAPEAGQMLFDPVRRRLIVYEYDTRSLSVFDPGSLQWSAADSVRPVPRYWHHDSAFLPGTSRFVTFGGYGEHTYKSLLTVVDTDEAGRVVCWESVDLSEKLPPRYLSGMVADRQGKLLVIGGYGSSTGLQSEGPHNFYDMYRVDPADGSVEPLGVLQRQDVEKHFVFGRDMVLSEDEKTVYALAYSDKRYASQIALIGIDWETGKATPYADYVPYDFSDIKSFCTLVHDRKKNELLLVETLLTGENQTRVEISALKYPPLSLADTTQPEGGGSGRMWWLGGGALLLLLPAVAAILLRRRKSRTPAAGQQPVPTEKADDYKIYRIEKRPSSILLLGGFQVVDKKGKDVTGSFTQIVRALFLLIMLDTYKNGRGISSQELRDILWFDKDSENARNNRNVNMHKLRTLLQQVGRVDISGENSYWHLELQPSVFCDYSMLLQVCREVEESRDTDPEALDTLVKLASLGKLLPNIQTDWIDAYKSEFSIRLIEHLMRISGYKSVRENPQMLFRIAEAILIHDNLDEDAIRIKCTALVQMGKKNQARQVYESFVEEFRKALDSDPDFELTDILK
jgi:DNA-binding SARP family transcriptional activator